MRAPGSFSPDDVVIGHSARMHAIFEFVKVVSRSDSNVIITGESGTGKEVIANLLHHASSRRHQPFVAVSCALFSESLIETELFGHERGAFTGAIKDKPGRFEMAQGGTLFLDDIDDVPLSMQVKLLRAIQNRTVERVGGTRSISVNVRVITGSKRDLKRMVADGTFREDLFYRLNVLPIALPPLRDRREDIPLLADFFFTRFSRLRGIEPPAIAPAVRYAFSRYRWPGNVRELENACERIVQTCTCGTVRTGCVAAGVLFGAGDPVAAAATAALAAGAPPSISLDDRLRDVESNLIIWALRVSDGNKSRAAELLSLKRSTLGDRMTRCGLSPEPTRTEVAEVPIAVSAWPMRLIAVGVNHRAASVELPLGSTGPLVVSAGGDDTRVPQTDAASHLFERSSRRRLAPARAGAAARAGRTAS
jgi:transcriptional regulator with GAF, ATPase, and Fis domain